MLSYSRVTLGHDMSKSQNLSIRRMYKDMS